MTLFKRFDELARGAAMPRLPAFDQLKRAHEPVSRMFRAIAAPITQIHARLGLLGILRTTEGSEKR